MLLGLFILLQLVFLLVSNVANGDDWLARLIRRTPPEMHAPLEERLAPERVSEVLRNVRKVTHCWGDLTGQEQAWELFAPNMNDVIPFVGVEMRWPDRPAHFLPSENEPADPHRFFRFGRFRLRRGEACVDLSPTLHDGVFDPKGAEWRETIASAVANRWMSMLAYLRWRRTGFVKEHPELPPPAEVILYVHIYRIPEPPGPRPWDWDDLGRHPVARWRPEAEPFIAPFALEPYDPVRGAFVDRRKETP